jgi:hypothetical protein
MNKSVKYAKECLIDNNRRVMNSPHKDPYIWNLHNAINALIQAFEEETETLKAKVAHLENQSHKKTKE